MKTMSIREKLQDYIRFAEERKIQALYTLIEGEVEQENSHWQAPEFIKELEKRVDEYENGNIKTRTWEEVKSQLK